MTNDYDKCQYKSCHHPLGPWMPVENHAGFGEAEGRRCEKCGGAQWRARIKEGEFLDNVEALFEQPPRQPGSES